MVSRAQIAQVCGHLGEVGPVRPECVALAEERAQAVRVHAPSGRRRR